MCKCHSRTKSHQCLWSCLLQIDQHPLLPFPYSASQLIHNLASQKISSVKSPLGSEVGASDLFCLPPPTRFALPPLLMRPAKERKLRSQGTHSSLKVTTVLSAAIRRALSTAAEILARYSLLLSFRAVVPVASWLPKFCAASVLFCRSTSSIASPGTMLIRLGEPAERKLPNFMSDVSFMKKVTYNLRTLLLNKCTSLIEPDAEPGSSSVVGTCWMKVTASVCIGLTGRGTAQGRC